MTLPHQYENLMDSFDLNKMSAIDNDMMDNIQGGLSYRDNIQYLHTEVGRTSAQVQTSFRSGSYGDVARELGRMTRIGLAVTLDFLGLR